MTDLPVRNRSLVVLSAAASRGGVRRSTCRQRGFTLLELLTVIAIVVVLAGLILGGMGYAQQKAASSRATGEIAALSNLLEAFKADFGDYPRVSQNLGIQASQTGAAFLAVHLFGSQTLVGADDTDTSAYDAALEAIGPFANWTKKNSWPDSGLSTAGTPANPAPTINGTTIPARFLIDPFGNPYGYRTDTTDSGGMNNPTFDLWSTAGVTGGSAATNEPRWIKNW